MYFFNLKKILLLIILYKFNILFNNLDTFKAFDKEGTNRVSRKDFIDFIEDSWKVAFRILGEEVSKSN